MRKIITVFIMILMVATAVIATPVTKWVYETENEGVLLGVDTDDYGTEVESINMAKLKVHDFYFVYNLDTEKYEVGDAKCLKMWVHKFKDLLNYPAKLVEDGYSCASLNLVIFHFNGISYNSYYKAQLYVSSHYAWGWLDEHPCTFQD